MKFKIRKEIFREALAVVSKAVSTKSTIPILQGILVQADYNGIYLIGMDGGIAIYYAIPLHVEEDGQEIEIVNVEREGGVVLPEKLLTPIVSKLRADEILIETNSNYDTVLNCGRSKQNLKGLNPGDFPQLPEIQEETSFALSSDVANLLIKNTVFAVAESEVRPVLTGVYWNSSEGIIKCTSTDSHRLAQREIKLEDNYVGFDAIVPGKNLTQLIKILPDTVDTIHFSVSDEQFIVRFDQVTYYSKLLDGTYPDTSRIIPQHFKTKIVLNRKELLAAVESCSILSENKKTSMKLSYEQDSNEITLSLTNKNAGKAEEYLFIEEGLGASITLSFNPLYITQALKAIESRDVSIAFNGPMSPFVVDGVDESGNLQLILPVRTHQ